MTKSAVLILCLALAAIAQSQPAPEPGLLFYLSGDHGLQADYAGGNPSLFVPGSAGAQPGSTLSTLSPDEEEQNLYPYLGAS